MKKICLRLRPSGELRISTTFPSSNPSLKVEREKDGGISVDAGGESPATLTKAENFKSDPTPPSDKGLRPGWGVLGRERRWDMRQCLRMRDAGAVMERLFPRPENSVFCTTTLPSDLDSNNLALAKWSGWFVNLTAQWLRDNYPDCLWLYRWEFQQRGALHIHWAISGPLEQVSLIREGWKKHQYKSLKLLGEKAGVNMFARFRKKEVKYGEFQCDAQKVTKSVFRYLSKYVGKQGRVSQCPGGFCMRSYSPSSLSGVCRALSVEVMRQTINVRLENPGEGAVEAISKIAAKAEWFGSRAIQFAHKYGPGYSHVYSLPIGGVAQIALRLRQRFWRFLVVHGENEKAKFQRILQEFAIAFDGDIVPNSG